MGHTSPMAVYLTNIFLNHLYLSMDRFIRHLNKYFKDDAPCRLQLLEHTKIIKGNRSQVYCSENESRPYWCYVLNGVVGAYEHQLKKPYLHWVAGEGHYFTGTKHEYSFNSQALSVQFLTTGTIACIPLSNLQQLQQDYPSVQHFVSIMRQRKSDFFNKKGLIMAHDALDRYAKLHDLMPSMCYSLNNKQLSQFLYIDSKTLYESKKIHLYKKK